MSYLFTSESVSEGHPDKIADQISDALVDNFLVWDPDSKIACETLVTTGQVVLAGEVKSNVYLDVQKIARDVVNSIGYTKSSYKFEGETCGVLSAIHEQSPDINRGVERAKPEDQGAGDQGIMFGYATNETENYMPLGLDIAHSILKTMSEIRKKGEQMKYLGPDAKSQVTIEYSDDNQPIRIDTIVVSTQHDEFVQAKSKDATDVQSAEDEMMTRIKEDIHHIVMPQIVEKYSHLSHLFDDQISYLINPTGKFVIGGPHGDAGLTGRKIIVDTYGGKGAHGGGAFSGKDPSKVDRSAAYAMRHLAKNIVAAELCDEVLVQISYAIGVAEPCGLFINTYGTSKTGLTDGELAQKISDNLDLRPYAIEQRLKLRQPIYSETAAYGHFGRKNEVVSKSFTRMERGQEVTKEMQLELFTWEKLDLVEELKSWL